jgi:aspartate aminotransferase-like enzyme
MRDISALLKEVYGAQLGGRGARQRHLRHGSGGAPVRHRQKVLVIRNGWFSYRWTQIHEMGRIPSQEIVLKARRAQPGAQEPFAPAPIAEVVATIRAEKPAVVYAPHVETSAGLMLPDDYLRRWPTPCTRWAACSCWTASPRARCGST